MLKINLGIAIVCMVNNTAIKKSANIFLNTSTDTLLNKTSSDFSNCKLQTNHSNGLDGTFVWSKSVQGFILASYFYGYIITQVDYLN